MPDWTRRRLDWQSSSPQGLSKDSNRHSFCRDVRGGGVALGRMSRPEQRFDRTERSGREGLRGRRGLHTVVVAESAIAILADGMKKMMNNTTESEKGPLQLYQDRSIRDFCPSTSMGNIELELHEIERCDPRTKEAAKVVSLVISTSGRKARVTLPSKNNLRWAPG